MHVRNQVRQNDRDTYILGAIAITSLICVAILHPISTAALCGGVALVLAVYKVWDLLPFAGKASIWKSIAIVFVPSMIIQFALPSHALFDAAETAATTLAAGTPFAAIIPNIFIMIELFVAFVVVAAGAFAIYQGSQSNDVRPIIMLILIIIGGVIVVEIGTQVILS